MSPEYLIGTSGWHYDHWRGNFYPEKLPKKDWLSYYSRQFPTVEINASFYRLPEESTFNNWKNTVPPGFCFAVKASRFITHIKRLKNTEEPLATFITRARCLKERLGPILYQLPPGLHRDDDRLEAFLKLLDKDLKHVFEFRHSSWMDETVFSMLRRYNTGFCIFDMPKLTSPAVATADFAYIRFHGKGELYLGSYPESELADWAGKLENLGQKLKTIYIYFNNDAGGAAIANAETMRRLIDQTTGI